MKSPMPSRSMAAACSPRTRSRRSSRHPARSAERYRSTSTTRFCRRRCATSSAHLTSIRSATVYHARFTPAECAAAATATGPAIPTIALLDRVRHVPFDINGDGVIARTRSRACSPKYTTAIRRGLQPPHDGSSVRAFSDFTDQRFDARVGLRGPLTSTIDWDVSGSYGESQSRSRQSQGYTLQSRFRAGRMVNGTLANPTCATVSGKPACVPIDIFGPEGSITPELVDFLNGRCDEPSSRPSLASCAELFRAISVMPCLGPHNRSGSRSAPSSASIRLRSRPDVLAKTAR